MDFFENNTSTPIVENLFLILGFFEAEDSREGKKIWILQNSIFLSGTEILSNETHSKV